MAPRVDAALRHPLGLARVSLGGYGKNRRVKYLYGATRTAVATQLTKELRDRDRRIV